MQSISVRLKEERESLGLSQQALADRCGIGARSQRNYESGERAPDATYLAAIAAEGADVLYILTGERNRPLPAPAPPDEQMWVNIYRGWDLDVKTRELQRAMGVSPSRVEAHVLASKTVTQTISSPVFGDIAGGNIHKKK